MAQINRNPADGFQQEARLGLCVSDPTSGCGSIGVKAGFWRRLAGIWVDSFVVYAVVAFLIALAAAAEIRVPFEPFYMVLAAVYGAILISRNGQTIGKILLGVVVTRGAGDRPGTREGLIREVVVKWGITIALPIILGRIWVGQGWVPTIYDVLILIPVLVLLFAHYLIAKQTWYDRLAGTTVRRVRATNASARLALIGLLGAAALGIGSKATEFAVSGRIPCRLALYQSACSPEQYVTFLEQGHPTPIDYVLGLFDRHDVVLLVERAHPEGSQWDFIYELVRDPRFVDRVGHIFTEYGQVAMQAYVDSFMSTDSLIASEVHDRAIHLMRHPAVWPVRTNTNWYRYLIRLYNLNQTLPREKRIRHHLTDLSVGWTGLTEDGYRAYRRTFKTRDEQMANVVIKEMAQLADTGTRSPKCLVVMNYRHAFDLTGRSPQVKRLNTYEFLKDAFEDRAANVLMNAPILLSLPNAGGVWDAAFSEFGNQPVGFDLLGSPFGDDPFDMFPSSPAYRGKFKYSDVFTGYVYTHPLDEQYLQLGTPGYFTGFEEEALRRAGLVGENYRQTVEDEIARHEQGTVPVKLGILGRPISSLLEYSQLGHNSFGVLVSIPWLLEFLIFGIHAVGLLIGIGASIPGRGYAGGKRAKAGETPDTT